MHSLIKHIRIMIFVTGYQFQTLSALTVYMNYLGSFDQINYHNNIHIGSKNI